jgi:hypothetical protein
MIVSDSAGLEGPPPTGCIQGQWEIYRGNLHSHTSHSDGQGLPAEAFHHARHVAGLDFLAVTDHLEQLYTWRGRPSDELELCGEASQKATQPGVFLALCGFEYGTGYRFFRSTGHNNVYFSPTLFPRIQADFRDFYASLHACEGCIAQFNHPARESGAQDWKDYQYDAGADRRLSLFELNGGADTWTELIRALDAGWHVAPTYGQDNHEKNWGTKNHRRTGLLLEQLTVERLREALASRRTFASWDRNASLVLQSDDGCIMGSILEGWDSLTVSALAEDPDPSDSFETLSFYTNGGVEIARRHCDRKSPCELTFSLPVTKPGYILAKAIQEDGDVLVCAPIWIRPKSATKRQSIHFTES